MKIRMLKTHHLKFYNLLAKIRNTRKPDQNLRLKNLTSPNPIQKPQM